MGFNSAVKGLITVIIEIRSARWIRACVCLICDFCYFSFIIFFAAIHLHPCFVLFDHRSVHKVVTMWWRDRTE